MVEKMAGAQPQMRNKEIIKRCAIKAEITFDEAKAMYLAMWDEIANALTRGERVVIRNFGRWQITHRKEYTAGIYGGRKKLLPATDTIRFKAANTLKAKMKETQRERRIARGH